MEIITLQQVHHLKLQALLNWANQITIGSDTTSSPPAKRVVALFYALVLPQAISLAVYRLLTPTLARTLNGCLALALVLDFSVAPGLDVGLCFTLDLSLTPSKTLALALALVQALGNMNIFNHAINLSTLTGELESLKMMVPKPNDQVPSETCKAFSEHLLQVWCKGLGLDRALINLSEGEMHSLANYMYIFELMARCKNSAVRVSRDVWESIENNIAMPTTKN